MGSVLPPEDTELFQERLLAWTIEEKPKGEVETHHLAAAVLASVRADRCARNEFAAIARKRRDALHNWQRRQDRKIARLEKLMQTDPTAARAQLDDFASGCGWRVERWEELTKSLDADGQWTAEQANRALRLLGHNPDEPAEDPTAKALRSHTQALRSDAEIPREAREAAREGLRKIVSAEVERLSHERAELWYQEEGPALAEEINVATIDLSPAGALRHRYAVSASSDLHKSFDKLARHQRIAATRERQAEKAAIAAETATPADHNDLCDWVRKGGQHARTPSVPRTAQSPAPPVLRTEPNEPPSSPDEAESCVGLPYVTTAGSQAVPNAETWSSSVGNAPRKEVYATIPPVSGP
jgi:hypothetical protein